MGLSKTPIFRMYRLKVDAENQSQFVKAGIHNLLTSHKNELGTLAMYATHAESQEATNYIFELYQDAKQYKIHAASPHSKAYGQVAQKILKEQEVYELSPQYLMSKDGAFTVSGNNNGFVGQLLELHVPSQSTKKFEEQLKASIRQEIAAAKGALVSYAAVTGESNRWIVMNIYRDRASLNSNRLINKVSIASWVVSKKLLYVDTMVSQGRIEYKESV